jgi:replicative DNA helicase Mcm
MEVDAQIRLFREFIEQQYHAQLLETVRKGNESIVLDFSKLLQFNAELSDEIIEAPEELLKAAEIAIKEFDLPKKVDKFSVRLKNLPESLKIEVNEIRSKHLEKFIWCVGIVRQKSEVRPHVSRARFECPSCGNILNVLQLDKKYKEPTRCSCGRKGKFKEISKELVDGQGMVLEESPDEIDGGSQPKRINVFLKSDLVSPISDRKTSPGSKVKVYGWVSEVPITLRTGGKSTKYDLILEANYIEPVEDDPNEMNLSEEDVEQIKEISKKENVLGYLANNIAPSIYGLDKIKLALVLQLVGGSRKERPDGVVTRGDMHILLIGDPGAGKCVSGDTKIMLETGEILPIRLFNENYSSSCSNEMKIISINECGKNFLANPIRFWKRKAPKEMLKIFTSTGNELVITKDHPLFTTQNGLIYAKKAKDYILGDYVALPSKINIQGVLQSVPYNIKFTSAHNKVKYTLKKVFDKEFARLIGYLVGDGYVRFRNTTGIISFTNTNLDLLNDFENLIKSVFGIGVSKRKIKKTNCFEYYASSIELVRVLEKIDHNLVKNSQKMCLSAIITKSPNYVVREFLQSLFDCEGHVNKNKREIEFTSKSKTLIFDLKYVLLRFGIISQVSSGLKYATNTINKIKRTYYRLRISGEDVDTFTKEIGFLSKDKQARLKIWIEKKDIKNTNHNIIPSVKNLLITLRKKYNLTQFDFLIPRTTYQHYERGDRFPPYKKLKKIYSIYKNLNINDPLIRILYEISHADIFWDKIKTIEVVKSNEDFVYDLEIDHVHNFIANGVMVHNSQLLKRITKVAPKARFTSGKGASAAGLTASVVKDEFLGGWSLEAGTLVLANKGFAIIDELDKMTKEDRSALHEAMEQQTVSISKANIQATLRCETSLLAAANPKFGRFDPYDLIANQINLPPTLINRFDLIFPVKDLPSPERDELTAAFILALHQSPEKAASEMTSEFQKKYYAYVRKQNPKLTQEAIDEIKKYYITMRNSGSGDDAGIKSIPITARQLEALVRLAEAAAKVRLSKTVSKEDAQKGIELIDYTLNQIAKDSETGKIDIDRISSRITATQRSKISIVKELIHSLESGQGQKIVAVEQLVELGKEKNISEEQIDEILDKLRRTGDIFEPRKGFIQRL